MFLTLVLLDYILTLILQGKKVVEEEEGGELGEEAKEEEEGEGEGEGEEVKAKGRDRHKKKRSKKSSKAEGNN